jgi:5-formyltetrahydrofolate cyclo-ligase
MTVTTSQLRQTIRHKRAALCADEIATMSLAISDKLCQLPQLKRADNIAVYMAEFGEVDCSLFVQRMHARGKALFSPVLRKNHLLFAPLLPEAPMVLNRHGILEPVYRIKNLKPPKELQAIVTPLVAFDLHLNRLGMGGGYYDRSFAFKKYRKYWRSPRLIGVAYSFQRVDKIVAQRWDVPLDAVITEKECYGSR